MFFIDFICKVLVAWFDFLVKNPELGLGADLIVYLQTSPEVSSSSLPNICTKSTGSATQLRTDNTGHHTCGFLFGRVLYRYWFLLP
jgi:hypothetical protein